MPMTWVTRALVIPSWRAMAAWLETSPDPRSVCHSMARGELHKALDLTAAYGTCRRKPGRWGYDQER